MGDDASPTQLRFWHVAPSDYEIRVKGRLSDTVTGVFEDFTASVKPAETTLRGEIRDQS